MLAIFASMQGSTTPVKTLTVGGLEVGGYNGTAYSVPIESVSIDEEGPGSVSSMSFDIWDRLAEVTIEDGDEVRHDDVVNDRPLFLGFVAGWSQSPAFGGAGRIIKVRCIGIEKILDWAVIPVDMTFAAGTLPAVAVQSLASNAEGQGPLNHAMVLLTGSTQAHPISSGGTTTALPYAVTVTAGTSLRDAIAAVVAPTAAARAGFNILATIDFYGGLRLFINGAFGGWADDYANLTVIDTPAGAIAATRLDHETDATAIVRGLFVKGGNAAGTGFMSDGTGKRGQIAYIEDATIDTAAKLEDAQRTYLNGNVIGLRGELALDAYTPTADVRPGSLLVLTDDQAGATGSWRIYGIRKTFNVGGTERWSIAYGGPRPSVTRIIRRLIATPRA